MEPYKIVKIAKRKGLEGIAVTDHNTIRGGLEMAKQADPGFHVIVGSEIRTEVCEIIGLILNEEITSTDPFEVIAGIKSQGGLAILPHPFRSKRFSLKTSKTLIEIAEKVDVIEAFNARSLPLFNSKAALLATKINKPVIAGSDAHFYNEIGNAKTLLPPFQDEEEMKTNILEGNTTIEKERHSFLHSLPFQVIGFLQSSSQKLTTHKHLKWKSSHG